MHLKYKWLAAAVIGSISWFCIYWGANQQSASPKISCTQEVPRRFYFIHVPKTGGTSLHALLENQIDLKEFYPPRRSQEVDRVVNHQLVSGHFPYWFCKQLDQDFDRAFKVTILRHPIDRYLSALRYKKKYVAELKGLNLEAVHRHVLAHEATQQEAHPNRMCQYLASDPTLTGRDLLQNAKEILGRFDFVLFLENFEEDLPEFCKAIGVDLNKQAQPHLNTTVLEEVSAEFMEVVRKHNELDIELYEYAKKHLKRKNTTYQFQSRDQFFCKTRQVNYVFSMPLYGDNWCYRENVDRFSRKFPIYRWVMDKPADISFPLEQNQEYILEFRAKSITPDIQPQVKVNGVELQVEKLKNRDFSTYRCRVPSALITKDLTTFTFFSPKAYKYNQIYLGDPDDRWLSFALNRIKINPEKKFRINLFRSSPN